MDKGLHIAGLSIAFALHVGVGASLVFAEEGCLAEAGTRDLDEARYVEAALAIKGEAEEESKQPQKPRERKPAPDSQSEPDPMSKDEEREPEPEPEPEEEPEPQEDFDPQEVLDRNRELAEDDKIPQEGVDREELGDIAGSDWGTELDAKGDPYLGELAGRVKAAWRLPSFEKTPDLEAEACVTLEEDGTIDEREIVEPSGNPTFDRSVALALEEAPDMEEEVPEHLHELLIGEQKRICLTFSP